MSMNSDDIDPSLRAAEPLLESLEDGFSPPVQSTQPLPTDDAGDPAEPALGPKSPF